MKYRWTCLNLLLALALVSWGCAPKESGTDVGDTTAPAGSSGEMGSGTTTDDGSDSKDGASIEGGAEMLVYCKSCGEVKGSEVCCDLDAEKCDCGLHKDSPLCCKDLGDSAGQDLCGHCGHAAGTEACCKDDCEKCLDCGLHKGSPLCCKLTKDAA